MKLIPVFWLSLQDVDEKLLHDTFSAFGVIVTNPKVMPSSLFYIFFGTRNISHLWTVTLSTWYYLLLFEACEVILGIFSLLAVTLAWGLAGNWRKQGLCSLCLNFKLWVNYNINKSLSTTLCHLPRQVVITSALKNTLLITRCWVFMHTNMKQVRELLHCCV